MLYVKTDIQICKGTATNCDSNKVYLGEFKKQRYYDHVKFFRNEFYGNNTTLSSYIWEIQKKKKCNTKEDLQTAKAYSNIKKVLFMPPRETTDHYVSISE